MAAYFKALPDFDTGPRPGGSGIGRYTSGRRLAPPYDLRDWMWVCVRRGETEFLLSLQTFDRDPNSGNLHALTDRIGVYAYTGAYSAAAAQEQMKITPLELPLSGADLDTLAELLRALSDCAGDRRHTGPCAGSTAWCRAASGLSALRPSSLQAARCPRFPSSVICSANATFPPRPRKLCIPRPAASGRPRSLRCSSSPHTTRSAGLVWGPRKAATSLASGRD